MKRGRERTSGCKSEGLQFIKMLYRTLLENDVNEKYVNQILDEAEKVMHKWKQCGSISFKRISEDDLKTGQPDTICVSGKSQELFSLWDRRASERQLRLLRLHPSTNGKGNEDCVSDGGYLSYCGYGTASCVCKYFRCTNEYHILSRGNECRNRRESVSMILFLLIRQVFPIRMMNSAMDMKKMLAGLDEAYEKRYIW